MQYLLQVRIVLALERIARSLEAMRASSPRPGEAAAGPEYCPDEFVEVPVGDCPDNNTAPVQEYTPPGTVMPPGIDTTMYREVELPLGVDDE